jgi:cytochrome c biogenesis protein CcmG/thiol:disulfide interchange protein DsbE
VRRKSLLLFLFLFAAGPAFSATFKVGSRGPEIVAPTSDGTTFNLEKLRGKTVVIHFWANWCPACRLEMPILDSFARAHSGKVVVIGLSLDREADRPAAAKVMKPYAFPWALLVDAKTADFRAPRSLPETILIDPAGVIRAVFTSGDSSARGKLTEANLAAGL